MSLHLVDWLVVCVYASVVLTVGLYLVKKPKTSEGYFLADRQLKWPFIGASLFAANISAEHFVGLASAGFAFGLAFGGFEWMAIFCLLPLILLFLPFYIKNSIFTVPEFLERRFSPNIRTLFSGIMVLLSVLTKISISLWASAIVFSDIFGWDKTQVIWIVGLITALYTMKGGLNAVVYTDAIQTTVLLVAATILTTKGMIAVGGWHGLQAKINDPAMFHMVKPITDPNVPWLGMFVGVFLAGSFYWSMDQVLVQRVFAAKDLNEGRKGAVFAAFLKVLTPILLVLPGLVAKALFADEVAKPDDAYPTLLRNLMPHGLLGLTVAGIAAALMGHLSATYNSIATLFTRDFYLKWRPDAGNDAQIRAGRLAVLVVFVLGAFWAPVIGRFESLWIYLQSVGVYIVMPFVGVFFLGVFWKRITTAGVWASVALGAAVGLTIMADRYSASHFLPFMQNKYLQPWLHGAIVQFVICVVVLVVVSLLTTRPPEEKVANTTINWAALGKQTGEKQPPVPLFRDYRPWLALVVAITATLWYIMR